MTLPLTPDDVRAIVREELRARDAQRARAALSAPDASRHGVEGLPDRVNVDLLHGHVRELLGVDIDGELRCTGTLTDSSNVVCQAHTDSSSVVPGVAPSGVDATVEAPDDTARPDSPRRVVGSPDSITIRSTSGTAPITLIRRRDGLVRINLEDGSSQAYPARDLAAWLIEAADQAEAVTA